MSSHEHDSDHDTSSTEDGSEDSLCNGGGLIDLEAEESGLGSSENSESDEESSVASRDSTTFPQFMQLPPELRHRIWHFYCPDLSTKARVLQFRFSSRTATMKRPNHYSVTEHFTMADQTETLRAMLSTHRESRSIAVLKYPDELSIGAGPGVSIIRFRKETDVISLDDFRLDKKFFLPGFAIKVQNLSICFFKPDDRPWLAPMVEYILGSIKGNFPNLKRVFLQEMASFQSEKMLRWCVMDYVHVYMVSTREKSPGLGEDLTSLFCWPDVSKHPDLAHSAVPRHFSLEQEAIWGVEVWPMVEFIDEDIETFDKLRKSMLMPDLGDDSHGEESRDSENDTEDGIDLNEYESEGIDDSEIVELEGSSEDELLTGELARFSSPESESNGLSAMNQVDDAEPVQRSRKRKTIVVDSDDDEAGDGDDGAENEDEPRRERARHSRLVLDSDDDDEEEEGEEAGLQREQSEAEVVSTRRAPNSARVMLISSDDDDDEEDKQAVTAISDSNSQDEGEDVIPAKLSLAERLQRVRKENPLSSASEGDSGNTDEDSGDEDEDEDDDEDEDGLLETMAGEETEDEEDDGDDAW